jgi:hypothetical protein
MNGAHTSVDDLRARLKLLKDAGVRTYKDGILEIHLDATGTTKTQDKFEDRSSVDLGKV